MGDQKYAGSDYSDLTLLTMKKDIARLGRF